MRPTQTSWRSQICILLTNASDVVLLFYCQWPAIQTQPLGRRTQ